MYPKLNKGQKGYNILLLLWTYLYHYTFNLHCYNNDDINK